MFSLGQSHRYYLYDSPCDMRKGFNGLCGLVLNELGKNPIDGSVYVFINRTRNQMKLLHWERGGLVLYQKRLERGRFSVPTFEQKSGLLNWTDLVLISEGIEVTSTKRKYRYKPVKEQNIS